MPFIAVALIGCADAVPTSPSATSAIRPLAGGRSLAATTTVGEEAAIESPFIGELNARLSAAGANVRIEKAELMLHHSSFEAHTKKGTILIADDREKGIGSEWVRRDFRRGGAKGVRYAFGSNYDFPPFVWNEDRTAQVPAQRNDVAKHIQKSMDAWRDLRCSNDPIQPAPIRPGTDPSLVDDLVRGLFPQNYEQPADIVHAGWQPYQFFQAIGGPDGAFILGVTFTFVYVDAQGNRTDVDGNGQDDLSLAEVYYNDLYLWGSDGADDVLDFRTIITHESGHALGLGHWGRIWVSEEDAADGVTRDEIRVFPRAIMNAVYLGATRIQVIDRLNFCRLWMPDFRGRHR
jgi:hypothetical protein